MYSNVKEVNIMQYFFTCPLEGCSEVMTTNAENDETALTSLVALAKDHLSSVHQDIHKTDEEIRADIQPKMVKSA